MNATLKKVVLWDEMMINYVDKNRVEGEKKELVITYNNQLASGACPLDEEEASGHVIQQLFTSRISKGWKWNTGDINMKRNWV